jgi:tetratricopeptide (TPR) repeat protein
MKYFLAGLVVIAVLVGGGTGYGAQDDARLDGLFTRLKAATRLAEARAVEGAIWRIWLKSGDAANDRIMARGVAAMAARDYAVALTSFNRLVDIAPDFAEAWNKRATVHYLMGNFRASVADIQRTVILEPRHFGALSGLGLVQLALGNEEQALAAFEAALKIYPLLPGANIHIRALRDRIKGRRI